MSAHLRKERMLSDALKMAPAEQGRLVLKPFQPVVDDSLNELLMFVKPEITELGPLAEKVLGYIEERLVQWDCHIGALELLGPAYMARHRLIEKHYGLINHYSRLGLAGLSTRDRRKFDEWQWRSGNADLQVFGAHQLLQRDQTISADDLLRWHDSSGERFCIGNGAHMIIRSVNGADVGVLNGFHPAQLRHFYQSSAPILAFTLVTRSPWAALRSEMVGATDPAKAVLGSVRRQLNDDPGSFHLSDVNSTRNAVHLSAGPIEGAAEIERYLQDWDSVDPHAPETNFSSLLKQCGLADEQVNSLFANKSLDSATEIIEDPFTSTEGLDTFPALSLILRAAGLAHGVPSE